MILSLYDERRGLCVGKLLWLWSHIQTEVQLQTNKKKTKLRGCLRVLAGRGHMVFRSLRQWRETQTGTRR